MLERLTAYWNFPLPEKFTPAEVLGLLLGASAFTFFSVVVLHAFIPGPQPVLAVLLHATGIAATYASAFALLVLVIVLIKTANYGIHLSIGQMWVLSFLTFILGFYFSPIAELLAGDIKYDLHQDLDGENTHFHFARMIPVWALITYVLAVILQKRGLEVELRRLEQINATLPEAEKPSPDETIILASGKTRHHLSPDEISHISVVDHYCYIFFDTDPARKIDVALPLRELEKMLPPQFIKVHRSHLVNLEKVRHLDRTFLHAGINETSIPISRRNLAELLAALENVKN